MYIKTYVYLSLENHTTSNSSPFVTNTHFLFNTSMMTGISVVSQCFNLDGML